MRAPCAQTLTNTYFALFASLRCYSSIDAHRPAWETYRPSSKPQRKRTPQRNEERKDSDRHARAFGSDRKEGRGTGRALVAAVARAKLFVRLRCLSRVDAHTPSWGTDEPRKTSQGREHRRETKSAKSRPVARACHPPGWEDKLKLGLQRQALPVNAAPAHAARCRRPAARSADRTARSG